MVSNETVALFGAALLLAVLVQYILRKIVDSFVCGPFGGSTIPRSTDSARAILKQLKLLVPEAIDPAAVVSAFPTRRTRHRPALRVLKGGLAGSPVRSSGMVRSGSGLNLSGYRQAAGFALCLGAWRRAAKRRTP